MTSKEILRIVNLANKYKRMPSELIGILDDCYASFCFDEACAFIEQKIVDKQKPTFDKPNGKQEDSDNLLAFLKSI